MNKTPNALINESSPYLLQHAYNPVSWQPWNEDVLQRAKEENKMILVSVGYSACHWCHVMENECFEDEKVARLMNDHFISIKVDREERPDIDQVYMLAVQVMTGRGGWPLNCFALPDGRPVYGGTYFPKQQWMNVLLNIADLWKNEPDKVYEYADRLMEGLRVADTHHTEKDSVFETEKMSEPVEKWMLQADHTWGGPNHSPKFPLPNNYQFLLRYNHYGKDKEVERFVFLTLNRMAMGGIYDQVQGGFARYSTDMQWKVPHFEKMLYDNAQLVSLYSLAFRIYKKPMYERVVQQSLSFIEQELTGEEGQFYSALDADSEGEEGKYYVWKVEELQKILDSEFEFAKDVYSVNVNGFWEHGNYILLKSEDDESLAKKHSLSLQEFYERVDRINEKLFVERNKRTKPGLDDKALCSWNSMMCSAYCDAYRTFNHENYIERAKQNMSFMMSNFRKPDGSLYHSYKIGKSSINGFLEDYSFFIEALINLYECTFNEQWLTEAKKSLDHAIKHFYNETSGLFYFTSDLDSPLIVRKTEVTDNVIPASNSVMANNLFILGHLFSDDKLLEMARRMGSRFQEPFNDYPEGYSNWGILFLRQSNPFYEIAIAGNDAATVARTFDSKPFPDRVLTKVVDRSVLSFIQDKPVSKETLIYVCSDKTCQRPVSETDTALTMLV